MLNVIAWIVTETMRFYLSLFPKHLPMSFLRHDASVLKTVTNDQAKQSKANSCPHMFASCVSVRVCVCVCVCVSVCLSVCVSVCLCACQCPHCGLLRGRAVGVQ